MERRKFTREFKVEAVKLIQERGVMVAQAARTLQCVQPMGSGMSIDLLTHDP